MAKGLEMASKRRLQLIQETTEGTYNAAGTRELMFSVDSGQLQPDDAFDKFRSQGFGSDLWNALLRTHSVYSGQVKWHYTQMAVYLKMLTGLPTTSVASTVGGVSVVTETYYLVDSGERDIVPYSLEDGSVSSVSRCVGAFLTALSMKSERGGNAVDGNATIMCRKPVAEGVAMTGGVAANEIQTISGTGAVVLDAQNGGTSQTLTPGTDNLAAIQTKLAAAKGVTNGHIIAAGTSVAAGTGALTNPSTAGTGVTGGSAFVGITGIYGRTYTWVNANGETLGAPVATSTLTSGSTATVGTTTPAVPTGTTAVRFYLESAVGSGIYKLAGTVNSPTIGSPAAFDYTSVPAASAAVLPTSNTTGALASLNITATFSGASVANALQALFSSATAGVTIARTQAGSDGNLLTLPPRSPVLPQNSTIRRATSLAGLDGASAMQGVRMWSLDFGALANPIWFQNENETTFNAHVDGENPTQLMTVELATSLASGATNPDCDALFTARSDQPATPIWFRLHNAHKDTVQFLDVDFLASPQAVANITANNNVRARNFPMGLLINDLGWIVKFTLRRLA